MTFGMSMNSPERRFVRVQEKGQVTLPVEVRKKLGIKKGDVVAVVDTDDGIFITPQEMLATKALDRIGEILRGKGLSLEELIESGRDVRSRIIEEQYGIRPADNKD
jgi:AbrB family looped-hinge helix DNA binding protein